MSTTTLLVRKDKLATTRLQTRTDTALADGQVRVQIARFALTSNNITYGAFGAAMQYWQFFPALDDDAQPGPDAGADAGTNADTDADTDAGTVDGSAAGWGCIPVWGFGVVVQSLHPAVAVGERLWGYWPMASHAVLQPGRLSPQGFADTAAHRSALHAVYNQYMRCNADPFYTADTESQQALLRPLYLTAWLIDDFLADNTFFGITAGASAGKPGVLLLSSASSKTAYATAARLALRDGAGRGVQVVGLTSPANVAFCQSLGVYHRVLTYDQLDAVAADTPCVYLDFAGNSALRLAIHSRFSQLAYSCAIGGTHVSQLGGAKDLPGPPATLFFAPTQVKKRNADWGAAEFGRRLAQDWHAFRTRVAAPAAPWLVVQQHSGAAAVQQAYALVLGGQGDARVGHVLGF